MPLLHANFATMPMLHISFSVTLQVHGAGCVATGLLMTASNAMGAVMGEAMADFVKFKNRYVRQADDAVGDALEDSQSDAGDSPTVTAAALFAFYLGGLYHVASNELVSTDVSAYTYYPLGDITAAVAEGITSHGADWHRFMQTKLAADKQPADKWDIKSVHICILFHFCTFTTRKY